MSTALIDKVNDVSRTSTYLNDRDSLFCEAFRQENFVGSANMSLAAK